MIISNDKKYIFIANPKTGTRSVYNTIKSNGISLGEHFLPAQFIVSFKTKDPSFDYAGIEKVYVFWRDPVERFISAVNFLRGIGGGSLVRRNLSMFPNITVKDSGIPTPGVMPEKIIIDDESRNILEAITPEHIFNDEMSIINSENPTGLLHVLFKQSKWMTGSDKMVILDYANFENNLKLVASDFGIDCANLTVPVLNQSTKFTTSLSPELEARVREYYAEDYNFQPH